MRGPTVTRVGTASFDFAGQVVLVTGGTKGLGRGLATAFASVGATVAVCARREPVADLPAGATFHAADLRDGEDAFAMVDAVVARHGRIDVLVNNAGGGRPVDTDAAPPALTQKVVAVNLLAAIYTSQRAALHMRAAPGGGSIVNVGSVVSLRPSVSAAAYGAAKAGLSNFTRTVGQEWAPQIRTNQVTVGMLRTEDTHLTYGDDASVARVEATIPVRRLCTVDDVAAACMFLASEQAAYVTGAELVLHGGGDRPTWLSAREA